MVKRLLRFKERIRNLTRRTRGVGIERMIEELGRYLTGWRGYFDFCERPSEMMDLEGWIRRGFDAFCGSNGNVAGCDGESR